LDAGSRTADEQSAVGLGARPGVRIRRRVSRRRTATPFRARRSLHALAVMDLVVITSAGAGIIIAVLALVILLIRWRRHQFRFSMRAMLAACTVVGCVLFAILRFVSPIIAHRWAIQEIYDSGGAVLFHQEDGGIPPGGIYSDPDKDNPWRGVDIVHAGNDGEAVSAARQLKHLPEATSLYLGKSVTDTGLAAIGDAGPHPSLASIDFFSHRSLRLDCLIWRSCRNSVIYSSTHVPSKIQTWRVLS
jgi:hypothetical protein